MMVEVVRKGKKGKKNQLKSKPGLRETARTTHNMLSRLTESRYAELSCQDRELHENKLELSRVELDMANAQCQVC